MRPWQDSRRVRSRDRRRRPRGAALRRDAAPRRAMRDACGSSAASRTAPYDRPPLSKEVLLDAGGGRRRRRSVRPTGTTGRRVELLLGVRAERTRRRRPAAALEDGARAATTSHLVDRDRRQAADCCRRSRATRTSARSAPSRTRSGCGELLAGACAAADRRRRLHRPGGRRRRARRRRRGDGRRGRARCRSRPARASDRRLVRRPPPPTRASSCCSGRRSRRVHGERRVDAVTLDDGRRHRVRSRAGRDRRAPGPCLARRLGPADRRHPDRRAPVAPSLPDVYAAGDAAAFHDPYLGRHALTGHWEAAGARAPRSPTRSPARRRAARALELLERPVRDAHPVPRPRASRRRASRSTATPARATSSPSTAAPGTPSPR